MALNNRIKVYVSYSWPTEDQTAIVDRLEQAAEGHPHIELIRDKNALCYNDSLEEFVQRIGAASFIVAVVSKPYLESEWCTEELLRVYQAGALKGRLFPIVVRGTPILKSADRADWVAYWERQADEFDGKLKTMGQNHRPGQQKDLDRMVEVRQAISDLLDYIAKHNNLTPEVHLETEFSELFQRIELAASVDAAVPTRAERDRKRPPHDDAVLYPKIAELLAGKEMAPFIPRLLDKAKKPADADAAQVLCQSDVADALLVINLALKSLIERPEAMDRARLTTALKQVVAWLSLRSAGTEQVQAAVVALSALRKAQAEVGFEDDLGAELVLAVAEGREPELVRDEHGFPRGGRWLDTHIDKQSCGVGPENRGFERFHALHDQLFRGTRPTLDTQGVDIEKERRVLQDHLRIQVDNEEPAYYTTTLLGGDPDETRRQYNALQESFDALKVVLKGCPGGGELQPASFTLASHLQIFFERLDRLP